MTPQPIERIPVFRCTVKGCPWAKEKHTNWCGHQGRAVTHLHWPKKGAGGNNPKSKIVALACWPCHDLIDNYGGAIFTKHLSGKGLTRWATDVHGNTLFERVLEAESSAVEGESPTPQPAGEDVSGYRPPSAAPPPVSKAESAAAETGPTGPRSQTPARPRGLAQDERPSAAAPSALVIPGTMTETSLTLPQNLSFEDWSDGVKKLSGFGHHYQFFLGDAIIFGEDRFGEEAWQTLDCLGLQPESIGNIVRVCRATPPPSRHGALKYSHHVVTYKLPPEERDKWLDVAEANQWGIREFRENVQGKPSRKKRWSLEELNTLLNEFGPSRLAWEFLDTLKALEGQGE